MTAPALLPPRTNVLLDRRNAGRALRITWHDIDDAFVLSTWRGPVCASTFQLTRSDVPDLISALARGLADSPAPWSPVRYTEMSVARRARSYLDRLRRHRPPR
jgi:hypothetical protein